MTASVKLSISFDYFISVIFMINRSAWFVIYFIYCAFEMFQQNEIYLS